MELWNIDIRVMYFLFLYREAEFQLEMTCSRELCVIALDLLKVACTKFYRSNMSHLTLPYLEGFFAAVKSMQNVLHLLMEEYLNQQTNDHFNMEEILNEGRNVFFQWLKKCFCLSMKDTTCSVLHVLRYPEELQVICQLHKIF